MRASNKSSFITGAALLLLAALFTISLILLPLDYGVAGPGHSNIFYMLGDMLYSVYGFCSILIPGFLLISGLSCFASKWTARKTLRLLTALVPFFTCVVTESIIRSILKVDHSQFAIVKILIALVTGAMLVVIEYLGTGIIADRINHGGFKNLRKKSILKTDSSENTEIEEVASFSDDTESDIPEFKKLSKLKVPKETILDKLKNKFKNNKEEDSDEEESENKPTIFDEILDDVQPYEEETVEETPENASPEAETSASEPQSSMLTQEEFSALTSSPADELEWPDLPPQPKNLPPEYDADFDENDPALEFPPKDPAPAENNDPYAATRYIDSVVENPLYPHKIVINDDPAPVEEEKKTPAQPVTEKPKYPTRIQLNEDAVYESEAETAISEAELDEYVEDETLPFPDFDIEEPAILNKASVSSEVSESSDASDEHAVSSFFEND